MAAESTREALIELYCKQLRLPGVRQIYREAARQAAGTGEGPLAFLAAYVWPTRWRPGRNASTSAV